MKKIYTFTLENDEEPSEKFINDLKLVAYMLYMEVYNYYSDDYIPVVLNDKINGNVLNNCNGFSNYTFAHEEIIDGGVYYEPFIIGVNSFGFTVVDEMIDQSIINELIQYVLRMLKLNYKVTINYFSYSAEDINDERNRKKAINHVFENLGFKMESSLVLKLIKNIRFGTIYEELK